jgi:hypothetical protein
MSPMQQTPLWRDANRLLVYFATMVCLALLPSASLAEQQCNPAVPRSTPTERFVLHAQGAATDRQTGLTWQRCALGQRLKAGRCLGEAATFTFDDALERFSDADQDGWRLPWIKELASIAELACWGPAINLEVFPDTASAGFWSASADASDSAGAWGLDFYDGDDNWNGRGSALRVRLVRAGQ